jgi:hypothetical protein
MSQVGPDYSYQNPQTAASQTVAKIQILEKKDPGLAKIAKAIFLSSGDIESALQGIDKVTADRLRGLFAQEIALGGGTDAPPGLAGPNTIDGLASGVVGSIRGFTGDVERSIGNTVENINRAFRPVSRELGQTIGNVTNMVRDPLGTLTLIPGSIKNVIERNNPEFAANLEGTYKKFKLDQIQHLPTILSGSLRVVDAVLTLPFIILSDIYQGLVDIITEIADAIDRIVSSVVKIFLENFLDGLILDVIELLNEISALAAEVQGIASLFGGVNVVTDIAFNLQVYAGQLGSFLSNPLDLLFAYAPPQVSEALYLLRNPQELVNNIIPPEINNLFAPLAKVTGFGFNGNMGYGFVSVLDGLRSGVLSSILTNFASQYPILTPILGILNNPNILSGNTPVPPGVEPSPVNPTRAIVKQGITQPQQTPPKVVPDSLFGDSRLVNRFAAGTSAGDLALSRAGVDPNNLRSTAAERQIAAAQRAGFSTRSVGNNPAGGPRRVDI